MPFEKGHEKIGGRELGTPNRATAEFKEFWQEFFESEEYRQNLKQRLLDGKADHMERYAAELLYGRPKMEIAVDSSVTVVLNKPGQPAIVMSGPQNAPLAIDHQALESQGLPISELKDDDEVLQ